MLRGTPNLDFPDTLRRVTELRPRVKLLFGSATFDAFLEAYKHMVEGEMPDITQFVIKSDDAQRALLHEMGFVKCR